MDRRHTKTEQFLRRLHLSAAALEPHQARRKRKRRTTICQPHYHSQPFPTRPTNLPPNLHRHNLTNNPRRPHPGHRDHPPHSARPIAQQAEPHTTPTEAVGDGGEEGGNGEG